MTRFQTKILVCPNNLILQQPEASRSLSLEFCRSPSTQGDGCHAIHCFFSFILQTICERTYCFRRSGEGSFLLTSHALDAAQVLHPQESPPGGCRLILYRSQNENPYCQTITKVGQVVSNGVHLTDAKAGVLRYPGFRPIPPYLAAMSARCSSEPRSVLPDR